MTDSEAQAVRRELVAFREEWEEAQVRRAAERRWLIGLAAPIIATYVATTIGWGWSLSAQVALNEERIQAVVATDKRTASHETRIAVLEAGLARMERTLDLILEEIRRDRREPQP